jgi:hypothetical protein
MFDRRLCDDGPGNVRCDQRIQFLQRRNERRSLSLMYAPAVNSGTRARKTAAARTRFGGDADDDRVDYPAKNEQIPE